MNIIKTKKEILNERMTSYTASIMGLLSMLISLLIPNNTYKIICLIFSGCLFISFRIERRYWDTKLCILYGKEEK